MLKGEIDTSFETLQQDLFASGLAAEIGMNAFGVWLAIKSHANFKNGACYPSLRRLGEMTGLSVATVQKCLKVLVTENLVRVENRGKGTRSTLYVARERITVRIGDTPICSIAMDYVPLHLRKRLEDLSEALRTGKNQEEVFALCEIIPAAGFEWNGRTLSKKISAADLNNLAEVSGHDSELESAFASRLKQIEHKSKTRKGP